MIDRKTVDELLEQAYVLIQQGDTDEAIKLGKQLIDHRHARGFEIIALAYEQQGKSQEAINVLKEGISKVPNAWPLWELLGNMYSDQDYHKEAHEAYSKALACPNADQASINYNYTILLKRQGKFDEALKLCEGIAASDLRFKTRVLRLSVLNCLTRYDDTIKDGTALIGEISGQQEIPEEDMQDLARAYAEVGRAHWEGKNDRQAAWENAWKALEWERSDNSALWLVREIIARKAASSKWFKLTVEGRWHFPLEADKPPPGFITTYEVVADSAEDALAFAQDLEPVEIRGSMKLDSQEEMGSFPDNNQGVYWRSAYGFFLP